MKIYYSKSNKTKLMFYSSIFGAYNINRKYISAHFNIENYLSSYFPCCDTYNARNCYYTIIGNWELQ